jgi:hypothetical protein
VFFVVLLAWLPNGSPTRDSGVVYDWTPNECHERTQKFSIKHNTPIQLCVKISKKGYDIIAAQYVTFNFKPGELEIVMDDTDMQVMRLKAALKEIGKWHVGKTRDSQRVRAIIKRAMK